MIDVLNRFEDGTEVTVDALLASKAISKAGDGVKILGNGELTKKLTVKVNACQRNRKSKNRSCRWYSRGDLMFETLKSVFKVKEMRRKLLYLIWMIFVIRIGSQLPVPGVDSDFFKQWFESNTGDAFNFFDAFTGGSFTQIVNFCIEHHTLHYFFHYHSASYHCHSGTGRDAA